MEFDYAVIGAGINGTWTAYHLSRRGFRTALIERFPLPHSRGSSHGQSRIIRKAYPQRFLRDMMDDAYEQWAKLEADADVKLVNHVGLLSFGPKTSNYLTEVIKGFEAKGEDNYKVYSEKELVKEFPSVASTSGKFDNLACLDKDGGVIFADKALIATKEMAVKFGCVVMDNRPVRRIDPKPDGKVEILCGGDSITAKGVAITAGPWAKPLLDELGFHLPLRTEKIPVFYWRLTDKNFTKRAIVYDAPGKTHMFGVPELEYPGLVKVCAHVGVNADPDNRDGVNVDKVRNEVKDFLAEHCAQIDHSAPAVEEACMYTLTPDGIHIMDRHPKHRNVVVGAGFSGTGFKLGPVTGEVLANLLTGEKQKFDLSPFAANRFTASAKL